MAKSGPGEKVRWMLAGAGLAASVALAVGLAIRPGEPAMAAAAQAPADGKLRVMVLGAHPDDCEIRAGGTAALWAAAGHHVRFLTVTNGDIGHWRMAGGPLAQRRLAEVRKCAEILGVTTEVLDIHDGELLPTLENRREITRRIREWKADLVISHRPNDYHPDHRYVGVLAQDSAYMVTVPFFCPDTPYLTRNPVFMFSEDNFQKPNPFQADVVVPIDRVIEKKLQAMEALESQFFEGGANGHAGLLPKDEAGTTARKNTVREGFRNRAGRTATRFRRELKQLLGDGPGDGVRYAEAFELCEYGRQPSREELRKMFPLP